MLKIVLWPFRAFAKTILFVSAFYGVLQLPSNVQNTGETLKPWQRAVAMVDQNSALIALCLILGLWLFWSDVRPFVAAKYGVIKRANQMRALAERVQTFALEYQLSRPSARDDLNFVATKGVSAIFEGGAEANVLHGPDTDPERLREIRIKIDERLNHELATRARFNSQFEGALLRHLRYAERKGLLDEGDVQTKQVLEAHYAIGMSWEFYNKVAATLRICADKLENPI